MQFPMEPRDQAKRSLKEMISRDGSGEIRTGPNY
jgi:hypothetical protein